MFVPLLLALLADGAEVPLGTMRELRGRLGVTTAPQGARDRLQEVFRRFPENTWHLWAHDAWRVFLERWINLDLSSTTPAQTDPLITWSARYFYAMKNAAEATEPMFRARELRDWYLATHPDIDRFTILQACEEADRWHRGLHVNEESAQAVPNATIIQTLPGGWTWQRFGPKDWHLLRREGESMGNCLAEGGYEEDIEKGLHVVFSLRKPPVNPGGPTVPVVDISMELPEYLEDALTEVELEGNASPMARSLLSWVDATTPRPVLTPGIHRMLGELREKGSDPETPFEHMIDAFSLMALLTQEETDAFYGWLIREGKVKVSFPEIKGRNNMPVHPRYREMTLAFLRGLTPRSEDWFYNPDCFSLLRPDDPEFVRIWTDDGGRRPGITSSVTTTIANDLEPAQVRFLLGGDAVACQVFSLAAATLRSPQNQRREWDEARVVRFFVRCFGDDPRPFADLVRLIEPDMVRIVREWDQPSGYSVFPKHTVAQAFELLQKFQGLLSDDSMKNFIVFTWLHYKHHSGVPGSSGCPELDALALPLMKARQRMIDAQKARR